MSNRNVIHGKISKMKNEKAPWGTRTNLFQKWGTLKINGFFLTFSKEADYNSWADQKSENLAWVEKGSGTLEFKGKKYHLKKGFAFKIFPGQAPLLMPNSKLSIISIQMKSSAAKAKKGGENLGVIKIVEVEKLQSKVYEYETLGKEIFTPKYKPGLGLLWFVFPIDRIPLHIHPYSDRIIRTISGKGYTFAEPNLYEMTPDSFTTFQKGTVHTNGPVPGNNYVLYAVQIPWIESKIDEKNIGGSPKFVKYVGPTPPKKLWKKKPDFMRVIKQNA